MVSSASKESLPKDRARAAAFGQFVPKSATKELEEAPPPLTLESIVVSSYFDIVSTVLTFLSALVNAMELQFYGLETGFLITYAGCDRPAREIWPFFEVAVRAVDAVLGVLFTLEMLIKFYVFRRKYFASVWNWLDFVAVAGWLTEQILQATGASPITLRIARLAKLARIARRVKLIKTLRALDSLQVLIGSIIASMPVLLWAGAFLLLVHMLMAMMLNSLVANYLVDVGEPVVNRREVYECFGTFTRAMFTTFELTLGNFIPVSRLLMSNVTEWFSVLMICYKMVIGFAFVSVIRGVFLHETFKVASLDDELMVAQKARMQAKHVQQMTSLLKMMDKSGDGYFTLEEFKEVLRCKKVRTWMNALEVEVDDAEGLFALMDDGDGKLSLEELVNAISRLRGHARSIDMIALKSNVAEMESMVQEVLDKVNLLSMVQAWGGTPMRPGAPGPAGQCQGQ